jgi:hypothetical protein
VAVRERRAAATGDAVSAAPTGGPPHRRRRGARPLRLRAAAVGPAVADDRLRVTAGVRRRSGAGRWPPAARTAQELPRRTRGREALLRARASGLRLGARHADRDLRRGSSTLRTADEPRPSGALLSRVPRPGAVDRRARQRPALGLGGLPGLLRFGSRHRAGAQRLDRPRPARGPRPHPGAARDVGLGVARRADPDRSGDLGGKHRPDDAGASRTVGNPLDATRRGGVPGTRTDDALV